MDDYGIRNPAVLNLVAAGYVGWQCTDRDFRAIFICSQACAEKYVVRGSDPTPGVLCQTCGARPPVSAPLVGH